MFRSKTLFRHEKLIRASACFGTNRIITLLNLTLFTSSFRRVGWMRPTTNREKSALCIVGKVCSLHNNVFHCVASSPPLYPGGLSGAVCYRYRPGQKWASNVFPCCWITSWRKEYDDVISTVFSVNCPTWWCLFLFQPILLLPWMMCVVG